MRRIQLLLGTALLSLVLAGSALAQSTPPTVDADDFEPILYAAGAALVAAVLALFLPVVLTKVPFAVINIAKRAISRFTGSGRPSVG